MHACMHLCIIVASLDDYRTACYSPALAPSVPGAGLSTAESRRQRSCVPQRGLTPCWDPGAAPHIPHPTSTHTTPRTPPSLHLSPRCRCPLGAPPCLTLQPCTCCFCCCLVFQGRLCGHPLCERERLPPGGSLRVCVRQRLSAVVWVRRRRPTRQLQLLAVRTAALRCIGAAPALPVRPYLLCSLKKKDNS